MTRAAVLLLASLLPALGGCTSFEPTYGGRYTDRPVTAEDADTTGPEERDAARDGPPAGDAASDGVVTPGVSFRRDIRPLLGRAASDPSGKGCKSCHYSTEPSHSGLDLGGLDLSTLGALREGGGSTGRRIVVAGKPNESGLVQKLRGSYPYGTRMPKNGPPFWSDADIKIVADWIAEGAVGADDE